METCRDYREGLQEIRTGITREVRRRANTPLEAERLAVRACPVCGCPREKFQPRNRGAVCCRPEHSEQYWHEQRPTISEMRLTVFTEQGGKCAACKKEIHEFNATEGPYGTYHHYVLDHIRPIAMGGDQWARENLQVLCETCNKIKTAADMGKIARWKKYALRGIYPEEDRSRQAPLLQEEPC
jgi:5-methylcytosine-specific restriction endonuclease McrA